jgi:hypothetical protein
MMNSLPFASLLSKYRAIAKARALVHPAWRAVGCHLALGVALVIQAQAASFPDADRDGMPDDWEIAHGLNPNDASDALADPDLDGMSNQQEYFAGTDPRDADSKFAITRAARTAPGGPPQFLTTFDITSRAQTGIVYGVEYKESLDAPSWNLLTIEGVGSGGSIYFTHVFTNRPSGFYRLYGSRSPDAPRAWSVNAVGFLDTQVPSGWSRIVAPFSAVSGASNTVSYWIPAPPDGTSVSTGEGVTNYFSYDFGGWENPEMALKPWEGFSIFNPADASWTLTLLGEVTPTPSRPPTITKQPANQTAIAGTRVTFPAEAVGTGSPGFQWQFNQTNIPGATAAGFTLADAQPSNAGNYRIVVSDGGGAAFSWPASLTVLVPVSSTSASLTSNGLVSVRLTGDVGTRFQIETSTNLVNWSTLTVLTNLVGSVQFSEAPTDACRFYRAFSIVGQ